MKCPFCGNDISNNTVYCPSCGQTVQNASNEASVNNYWKDNNAAITKADKDQKAREAHLISENRKQRSATFMRLVLVVSILAALVLIVLVKNANNQKTLEAIHQSMIGNEYYDTSEGSYWVGASMDRRVVTITDEDTLKFVEGYYRSYTNSQGTTSWEEKEIYRTDTFSYELSISFWGEVTIHFAGAEFEVYIRDDDGTVWRINMY